MKKLGLTLLAGIVLAAGCSMKVSKANEEVKLSNTESLEASYGTYLPEVYLDGLRKYKSHTKASLELRKSGFYSPNVIVLNEEGLECNYNFHEGEFLKMVDYDKNSVTVETYDGTQVCKVKGNHNLYFGEVKYVKVDKETNMNNEVVSSYLKKVLLPQGELKSGSNTLSMSGSKINYNGETYDYGVSLVFTGHKYDHLTAESLDSKKYIEITNRGIKIYNVKNHADNNYDSDWESAEAYELESEFNF